MRLLGVAGLVAVLAGTRRNRRVAVKLHRLRSRRLDCLLRQGRRVGAHISDVPLLVEALRDAHRVLGAHRELAAGLLLQGRGGEGRLGAAGAWLGLQIDDGCLAHRLDRSRQCAGGGLVEDDDGFLELTPVVEVRAAGERRAVDPCESRSERGGVLGGQGRDIPVRGGDVRDALALAVDDEAGRRGLHATGAERGALTAAADLAPQHGRDVPAVEAVEHAARLLGVDEREVELSRVLGGRLDRILGDLVEDHPLDRDLGLEHLEQVPRDRLALAILICREQDFVGGLQGALELGDGLRLAIVDHVVGVEVVVDIDRILAVRLLLVVRDLLLAREIANVPDGAEHLVAIAEVTLDRLHLRR